MNCPCQDLKQPGKILLTKTPEGVASNSIYLEKTEWMEETYYLTAIAINGYEDFVRIKYCPLCGRKLKEDK